MSSPDAATHAWRPRLRPRLGSQGRFYARPLLPQGGRDVPRFTSAFAARDRHTRTMRRRFALPFLGLLFGLGALLPAAASAATPHVEQADLNGDINNIMSSYIQTSVTRAENDHADAL